jgi:hypothetical protein
MKKLMLTAVAVITFAFSNAQETRIGIKGGVNLTSINGYGTQSTSRVGFQVGGFAEIKISDKFAIQPELLLSTQGRCTEISGSGFGFRSKEKSGLVYLNIPVMAKFYVVDKFSIEAGPQIRFLLGAKSKWEVTSENGTFSGNDDVKSSYDDLDLGVNLGAGYDFTKDLSVGFRYNLSLTSYGKSLDGNKIYNSVYLLSVGYKF